MNFQTKKERMLMIDSCNKVTFKIQTRSHASKKLSVLMAFLSITSFAEVPAKSAEKAITIYAYANEDLIKPLFEAYTKHSGTKVNYVIEKGAVLLERLKAEGAASPADIYLDVDAGNLWNSAQSGVLSPIQSKELEKIPASYRDSQGRWFGFSLRARTIFYNPEKVSEKDLKDYQDLSLPKWKSKLCLRSSSSVYNQSLMTSMIERYGEKESEKIAKGWSDNLATTPFSSDSVLLKAIDSGTCQIGIANTYYFAKLIKENPAIKVKVFFPASKNGGVHVNVRGGGVVATSKNKVEAQKFLEWMIGAEAQKIFSSANLEFPILTGVPIDPVLLAWGKFSIENFKLQLAGEKQKVAVMLMDKAGYK